MRHFFSSVILILFISCTQSKQSGQIDLRDTTLSDSSAVQTDQKPAELPADPIAAIRQKVEHINTAKLESKHYEFMCDEKTTVDYFYENGEIVKIAIDFGTIGDVYAKEGYYYDKGELIFFYEFVEGGPACEGCIKTNEYRSYIANGKVIKHLKDDKETECRKCEFLPSSRQYKLLSAVTAEEVREISCRF